MVIVGLVGTVVVVLAVLVPALLGLGVFGPMIVSVVDWDRLGSTLSDGRMLCLGGLVFGLSLMEYRIRPIPLGARTLCFVVLIVIVAVVEMDNVLPVRSEGCVPDIVTSQASSDHYPFLIETYLLVDHD